MCTITIVTGVVRHVVIGLVFKSHTLFSFSLTHIVFVVPASFFTVRSSSVRKLNCPYKLCLSLPVRLCPLLQSVL